MVQHATETAPTVSVVVITHNSARTIAATLASIVGQDRPPDEVVVSDDASSDDTLICLDRFRDQLPLVVLRNNVNLGPGGNRARAFAAASGDLIAPVDGDDVLLPDHLSTVVPLAGSAHLRTIVATRRLRWQPGVALGADDQAMVPAPERQVDAILRANFLFVGSLFPRAALAEVGGGSDNRLVDDWANWIRLIVLAGCRVVPATHPTVLYRSSPSQLSASDGCLPSEIDLCEELLADPRYAAHHELIAVTLRRRLARRSMLEGFHLLDERRPGDARKAFGRAILVDRSLRGGTRPTPFGSIAIRATASLLVPSLAARDRRRRVERQLVADIARPKPTPFTTDGDSNAGPERRERV